MHYVGLLLCLLSFNSFALSKMAPTKRVYQTIQFSDDLNLKNMVKAIDRQLVSFNSESTARLATKFILGTVEYDRKRLKESMVLFKKLVLKTMDCLKTLPEQECYKYLSLDLNNSFNIYKPLPKKTESGYSTGQSLFTSYYSPDFKGSKTKTDIYKYPIYSMPKDEKLRTLSREAIDFDQKLAGKGLELFYVSESLYDIWLLHVEGGGRVQVQNNDGTITNHYLSYAGTNSGKFTMLYRYMKANNMLQDGKTSIAHQRAYLESHPEHRREVFASCPSYIFFKVTKDEPLGVKNIPLTVNRSLATDYRIYQEYGIINFIQTKKPIRLDTDGSVSSKKFSRFMINQDTGGAIRGNARSDLYFGFGKKAEFVANHLKYLGMQYFLIKKEEI